MIDLVVIIKIFELIGIDISNWLGIKYYWLCKYFFFLVKRFSSFELDKCCLGFVCYWGFGGFVYSWFVFIFGNWR